jgi:MoaA/NifB/PqqE/SkfB family radical SAM enzyme
MIVVWRITGRCNLACAFCAYDRRLGEPRYDADPAVVERFGKVLGDYRRLTGDRVLLSWLGGEPLLWPALFPLSQKLRETQGLAISATTNGTTLERPGVRSQIVAHFTELTVSVDGFAEFHERLRGWRGGWQRLRAGVQALALARAAARAPLKLRANVLLMHDNLSAFEALCTELAAWGFDEITFNQLGGRDRPEFFPAHRLTADDVRALRALLPALQASLARRGVRLCASARYLERIAAAALDRAQPVQNCAPGTTFLFVDEHHRVSPCSFTVQSQGIATDSIQDAAQLLALPALFANRAERSRDAACADCQSTRVFAKFED